MKKNNNKRLITSITLLLLVAIGIGYAYLNSNLSITGSTTISNNTWNIHFQDIVVTEGSVAIDTNSYASAEAATIDNNDTTKVTYNVLLSKPGDFYEFTIKAVNDGTIDAMIESISSKIKIDTGEEQEITSSNLPSWLSYSVTYSDGVTIANNHLLAHGSYETYKIRIELKKDIDVTELQDSAGKHIKLTYQVNYTQSNENAIDVPHPKLSDFVNLGDYITITPDADTYTISSIDTGYSSDQTISPNELKKWRVIAKNDDGSIDIVSDYLSSNSIYLKGVTGYANGIAALQSIAHSYAKEGYTKSERIMGFNGQTPTISNTSDFNGSKTKAPGSTNTTLSLNVTQEEFKGGVLGDTLYIKDYLLVRNVYKTGEGTYQNGLDTYIVNTETKEKYWISSRFFFNHSNSLTTSFMFMIGFISFTGQYMDGGSYLIVCNQNNWNYYNQSAYIRPILTIYSNIKINTGDGTQSNPYTLIKQ